MPEVPLVPVGPHAVLAEVADAEAALDLAAHLRRARVAADEVVPGARTVLVDGLHDGLHDGPGDMPGDRAALAAALAGWTPGGRTGVEDAEPVELPVVYDGPDLDDVAERWGTDRAGVVARHAATVFTSAFCGFAPGFAYLTGLPGGLAVPRLESPRPSVPAGSVGLAGAWCGVYPTASPGGWRLLGRTDAVLWDPDRDAPALLAPGTRVRFVPR